MFLFQLLTLLYTALTFNHSLITIITYNKRIAKLIVYQYVSYPTNVKKIIINISKKYNFYDEPKTILNVG